MKGPTLLLLCAVTLTHSVDPKSGQNEQCNCNPSEAWQICDANFGKENVLIAHEFCDRFYTCVNGRPVAQNCPAGLMYNPYTEVCDWAANVDCGERPISDGQGTDDADCDEDDAADSGSVDGDNHNVEEDNNGSGDNGTGDSGNGGGDTGGSDNGSGDNGGSDTGSGDNGGSDNVAVGGGNCDPSEAPSICAADDSENVLVAHENCNQFYICAGGKPVALKCPNNLLFNPNTDQCDWPESVDCGDRVIPDPEDNDSDGSDNGDSDNGGSDNGGSDNGGSDNGGSDNGGSDNGGSDNGGSDNGGSDNGGSDNGGSDNGGSDNGGGGSCNCNPGEAPEICAADDSNGVLVANENCNQFYICANGKPIVFTCPANLLYNPYTEQCDWAEKVECGDRIIPDPDNNDNGGTDNGGSDNGGSDNGGSDNGGSDNGGSDNGGGGTCNCNPGEAPEICAADDAEGVLVANENCNQFYKCANGKPVVFNCPPNLLYNPYTEQCDWPENVECGDRVIPDPEDNNTGGSDNGGTDNGGSDNGGSDNGGSDNGGSDNGGSDNGGGGTCNCNPGEAPEICAADDAEGVLVANENCNQFYKCANGKPVVFNCPPNLLYNPYTEQCDWPENVECGDRVIPDPEDNNTGGSDNGGTDNGGSDNGGSDNGGSDNGGSDNGGSDNGGGGTCNCNPGEAPEICAADDAEGVLVANENCNQFYKCANGKPVVFNCPPNLLYNPYTEQCDWPENVECGDRVIPDPEDNNTGGSDNGGTDNGGSDNGGSDNGGSDNGGSDNGGSDNGTVGGGNCDPSEAPSICASDESQGVLVANEYCNKYYICSGGKPVAMSCPAGLLFNPTIDQCDWPANVDCGDRVIPDPEDNNNGGSDNGGSDNGGSDNGGSDNGGSDNGGSDNGGNGTCNCNPGEAPEICAADNSNGVLIANENCNQFYICTNGVPVALTCPSNLLYNPYTEQCDWAENVECGDRVIPDPEDNNNGGSDNGGSDNDNGGGDNGGSDNDGSGTCNCNPGEAPEICAAEGADGVLIANENCNQFYICSYGKPVAITCPSNLLYNPYTEKCDWPENVECGDRVIPDPEDNNNGDSDNDGSDDGGSDNGDSDNGGSDNGGGDNGGSDNGGSDNGGSDNDGNDNGTCNCNPEEAPEICAADGSDGVLIANENCNQFYNCFNGKPVVLTCPANLLYNPYTEQCDWPENVDCGDRVIPDPEDNDNGSDNGGSDNGGSDNGGSDNDGSDNDGNDNGSDDNNVNDDPSQAPAICADGGSNGVFVAHENCDQYYMCTSGVPVAFTCPGDLLFNPLIQQCDWPRSVDCGDRIAPDVEGCYCNPRRAPALCAGDHTEGLMIAHESCNQFYVCDGGMPVARSCPGVLFYNPQKQVCDWPMNVDCDSTHRVSPFMSLNKHLESRETLRK